MAPSGSRNRSAWVRRRLGTTWNRTSVTYACPPEKIDGSSRANTVMFWSAASSTFLTRIARVRMRNPPSRRRTMASRSISRETADPGRSESWAAAVVSGAKVGLPGLQERGERGATKLPMPWITKRPSLKRFGRHLDAIDEDFDVREVGRGSGVERGGGGRDGEAAAGADGLELGARGELREVGKREETGDELLAEETEGAVGGAGAQEVIGGGEGGEGARPGGQNRRVKGRDGLGELLEAEGGEDRGQEEGLVRFLGRRSERSGGGRRRGTGRRELSRGKRVKPEEEEAEERRNEAAKRTTAPRREEWKLQEREETREWRTLKKKDEARGKVFIGDLRKWNSGKWRERGADGSIQNDVAIMKL